ncbi:hypothetical protein Pelo_3659 [Pelomyxa schiedti]|nr:hypothetical protein Pelo_3659 [Pelomyxa schiedti]
MQLVPNGLPVNVPIAGHTYARDQFVALGAGVIVGRCGRSRPPVSALSPPLLSFIGREWVVLPANHVVLSLILEREEQLGYVKFSVSPTLGLMQQPTIADAIAPEFASCSFIGWFGPAVRTREQAMCADSSIWMGHGVWNFYSIEWNVSNGRLTEWMHLPWPVDKAALDGSHSLVVAQLGGMFMLIDLDATLSQKVVVGKVSRASLEGKEKIDHLVLWKGIAYALLTDNPGLLCLTTGQRLASLPGRAQPIGGPYFAVRCPATYTIEVFSVEEPTKLCSRHREQFCTDVVFSQELLVRDHGSFTQNGANYIEVIDALSGFVVFKMPNREPLICLLILQK